MLNNSMEIIKCREAKKAGRKRYFNGKTCSNGHVAERYVSNRSCVECRDNVKAAYYVKLGRTRPDGRYRSYKEGARTRELEFALTLEEFTTFWQKPCAYCGDDIKTIGLDRMNSSKGYTFDNVCSCCASCNTMKSNRNKDEWLEVISRIYNTNIKK